MYWVILAIFWLENKKLAGIKIGKKEKEKKGHIFSYCDDAEGHHHNYNQWWSHTEAKGDLI